MKIEDWHILVVSCIRDIPILNIFSKDIQLEGEEKLVFLCYCTGNEQLCNIFVCSRAQQDQARLAVIFIPCLLGCFNMFSILPWQHNQMLGQLSQLCWPCFDF